MNILYFMIDYVKKIVEMQNILPFFVLFAVGLVFAILFKLGHYNDRY